MRTEPVQADPVVAQPVVAQPVVADPAVAEPVQTDPVVADPLQADPVQADPVQADPVVAGPPEGGSGVTARLDGGVLTLTLDRPDRLNALTAALLDDLARLLDEASRAPAVRVVVVTGAGRAFSSGADLGDAAGARTAAPEPAPADPEAIEFGAGTGTATPDGPGPATLLAANRVVRTLQSMPQPTVAAVNGPAVGVGCSIALGCDLVVAAESAYFYLSFTAIGLMPDGGATALVPANVGRARAMEMALVPERIPAPTAREWGLIYRVVPDGDLAAEVSALTARLTSGAPQALAATKRAVNAAALAQLEPALARELDGQVRLLGTADFGEAVAAFAAKRPPRFTGH